MPRTSNATPEDWVALERGWRAGEIVSWEQAAKLIAHRASAPTIKRRATKEAWVRDNGEPAAPTLEQRQAQTEAAREAARRHWADEKDRVIDRLVGLVDTLIDEVTAPHEMIDVKVVGGGKDMPASVETIRTEIPSPVPADKQRLVTSAAIVIDKLQLLTGEATSRNEQLTGADRAELVARTKQLRDELAERRDAKEIQDGQAKTG